MKESFENNEFIPSLEEVAEALASGREQGIEPAENELYQRWAELKSKEIDSGKESERLNFMLDTAEVLLRGDFLAEAADTMDDLAMMMGGADQTLQDRFRSLDERLYGAPEIKDEHAGDEKESE